jgi:esterase/lipase superfamily enzyme
MFRNPGPRRRPHSTPWSHVWPSAALSLLLLVAWLSGCSPYPYTPYPPRVTPALGELCGDHAAVRLYYATDRRPTGVESAVLYYGAERTNELHVGTGIVSIPARHGRGRLEGPAVGQPVPGRHVALMTLSPPMDHESFLTALRAQIERSARREVFVFIHGYAAFFADAARRTAQIAHDADLDGVAIAYSWPTQGWLLAYLIDGVNAEWTVPHLVDFLTLLADESGAEHIHLLAHSMGTRVLTCALKEFVRGRPQEMRRAFDQIVLVAADMDAELFERDYAPFVVQAGQRLTIYVSAADWALGGSQRLHKYARLGQFGPTTSSAPWLDRVDVIDATAVDKGVVGHVYYGSSPTFLEDLSGVLRGGAPEARGLQRDRRVYKLERRRAEST